MMMKFHMKRPTFVMLDDSALFSIRRNNRASLSVRSPRGRRLKGVLGTITIVRAGGQTEAIKVRKGAVLTFALPVRRPTKSQRQRVTDFVVREFGDASALLTVDFTH